jgi:hypothetical protein
MALGLLESASPPPRAHEEMPNTTCSGRKSAMVETIWNGHGLESIHIQTAAATPRKELPKVEVLQCPFFIFFILRFSTAFIKIKNKISQCPNTKTKRTTDRIFDAQICAVRWGMR